MQHTAKYINFIVVSKSNRQEGAQFLALESNSFLGFENVKKKLILSSSSYREPCVNPFCNEKLSKINRPQRNATDRHDTVLLAFLWSQLIAQTISHEIYSSMLHNQLS